MYSNVILKSYLQSSGFRKVVYSFEVGPPSQCIGQTTRLVFTMEAKGVLDGLVYNIWTKDRFRVELRRCDRLSSGSFGPDLAVSIEGKITK